jgi:hypothetical protein
MNLFQIEAAKLNHPEIQVRFGAVQELCRNAQNLVFFQRLELVIMPVMSVLLIESDSDTLEAGLWWLSKVINPHPDDSEFLFSLMDKNSDFAELLLSCIGRHPSLHRSQPYAVVALEKPLLDLVFRMEKHHDARLKAIAEIILIQLDEKRQNNDYRTIESVVVDEKMLKSLRDPLMCRRLVALAPSGNPLLPEIDTLCDPDAFIAHRAMGRLLEAGCKGDEQLQRALLSDEPKAIAAVFDGLTSHSKLGKQRILNNPVFTALADFHLQPGLTYTRRAALECILSQADAFLAVNPRFARCVVSHAWDSDETVAEGVVHFIHANATAVLAAGVDVLPVLIAAIKDCGDAVAIEAIETLAAHADEILVDKPREKEILIELLRHHLVWNGDLSLTAAKAIISLGPASAVKVPELTTLLLSQLRSTTDAPRMSAAKLLCALGATARSIDPGIDQKIERIVPLHQFHSDINDWPVRMLLAEFLNETRDSEGSNGAA